MSAHALLPSFQWVCLLSSFATRAFDIYVPVMIDRCCSPHSALTYCGVCVCACVDWRPVAAIPGCKSSLTLLSLPVLLTCVCACDESSHYALTHCGVCMCVSAGDSLPSFQTFIFLSCPSAGAFDLYLAPFACDDSSCRALTRCGSCVRLSADAPLS